MAAECFGNHFAEFFLPEWELWKSAGAVAPAAGAPRGAIVGGTDIAGQRTIRALESLEAAMARLEAAASLNSVARDDAAAVADDRDRLMRDRAILADALDRAEAHAAQLESANREVEARLVGVMDMVRRQMRAAEGGEP